MRTMLVLTMLAMLPAGAIAQSRVVRDGSNSVPDVRIHTPRAGTSWRMPQRSAARTESMIDDADVAADRRSLYDDAFDDNVAYDDGASAEGYSYAGQFRPEDRDREYPQRLARDDRDALDYDRDYPYEYPSRADGGQRMIMTETVTTTTYEPTTRRVRRRR